jgi:Fur family peroxide stress response transcriptional regulator
LKPPSKYSHQREAIISFLKTRTDHPTADVVYQNISETIPNISLGTVYRNLNQLADAGVILRFTVNGRTDRYDADTSPHCHFICKCCGAVKDIFINPTEKLIEEASSISCDSIENVSVFFHGICEDCNNN